MRSLPDEVTWWEIWWKRDGVAIRVSVGEGKHSDDRVPDHSFSTRKAARRYMKCYPNKYHVLVKVTRRRKKL